jgi:hypothetical protein
MENSILNEGDYSSSHQEAKFKKEVVKFMRAEDYLEIFRIVYKNITEGVDKEKVAIAIMQEMGKDQRMQSALAQREQGRQEKATARQIAYLKAMGVLVGYGLTKKRAAELIDRAKANYNIRQRMQ